jgi:hypothetical protein
MSLENVVDLFALLILASYVIFSAVLYYHWETYTTDGKVQNMTLLIFFASTLPLLLVMGVSALLI